MELTVEQIAKWMNQKESTVDCLEFSDETKSFLCIDFLLKRITELESGIDIESKVVAFNQEQARHIAKLEADVTNKDKRHINTCSVHDRECDVLLAKIKELEAEREVMAHQISFIRGLCTPNHESPLNQLEFLKGTITNHCNAALTTNSKGE